MSARIDEAAAALTAAFEEARAAELRAVELANLPVRRPEEQQRLQTLVLALPLLLAAVEAKHRDIATARAADILAAIPIEEKTGLPAPVESGGLTLFFDQVEDLDTGIGLMVRAYRAGREVPVDGHRRFWNPPICVPDGWFETIELPGGEKAERATYREAPWAAIVAAAFESVEAYPERHKWGTKGTVDTFYVQTVDGFLESSNAAYATARSGGTASGGDNGGLVRVGQLLSGSYFLWEGFISFDTASIDDAATASQVDLSGYGNTDNSTTDFTINARLYTWGPQSANWNSSNVSWVAGASISGNTLVASLSTAGFTTSGYNAFTESGSAFRSGVNKTGVTYLMLSSDRLEANTAPGGAEYLSFVQGETAGTTQDFKLVVTYSTTAPADLVLSTIAGVASATAAVSTKGFIVPSTIAGAGSATLSALSTPAAIVPSAIAGQSSAALAALSTPAFLVPSTIAGLLSITNKVDVPAYLVPSTIAGVSAATLAALIANAVIVPSTIAGVSSVTVAPFSSPTFLALSAIAALLSPTLIVSTKGFIVPSTIAGQSALTNTLSSPGYLSPETIVGLSSVSAAVKSPALLTLSAIVGTSTVTISLSTPFRGMRPLIRVDVYSAAGVKLGSGPVPSVLDFEYDFIPPLDRIGSAVLRLAADDPAASVIDTDTELRIFRGGEGFIFDGLVRDIRRGRDATGVAVMEVDLDDYAIKLARANTGFGLALAAASPATVVSTLLSGTGFSAGTVDSSTRTRQRRHDAAYVWPALVEDAPPFGFHVRYRTLGTSTSPSRLVDFGDFGTDSGLIFGAGDYPLADIRKHTSRATLSRVVPVGVGDGFPMLSLKAATHGANLCTNGDFETNTTGWTPSAGTIARSSVQAKLRSWSGLVTRTSSTTYYADIHATISGSTSGKTYKAGIWVFGVGSAIGKSFFLQLDTSGGSTPASDITFATLVAGWQYVSVDVAAADANTTDLRIAAGQSGAVAGDTFYIDRVTLWDSTACAYCVENDLAPDASSYYFICDPDLEATNGVLVDYKSYKGDYPTAATKAAWQAACDAMCDAAAEYLTLNKVKLDSYEAKPLGLQHVSAGSPLILPGDKARLFFHGVANGAGWLSVNQLLWVMGGRRRLSADGSDESELTLSSVDVHYVDAQARLAQQLADWQGSQTALKQSNYTFAMPLPTVTLGPGAATVVYPSFTDVLAIQKCTLRWVMTAGTGSPQIATELDGNAGGATSTVVTRTPVAGTYYEDDLTAYITQLPTPVPNEPIGGGGGWRIWLREIGGTNATVQGVLYVEATKIPLKPS